VTSGDHGYSRRTGNTFSHGWPLSSVTALELLAAIDATPPEDFPDAKARIASAYYLSKGHILEDP
jgi:hypothetical protein